MCGQVSPMSFKDVGEVGSGKNRNMCKLGLQWSIGVESERAP